MPTEIEIFRTGTHVSASGQEANYSADDLAAIATAYDPEVYSAPIVVGHPKTDAPAYGWIKSLKFEDDKLIAEADHVDQDFQELVKAGRYRNVSASFYLPNHKSNPSPGVMALRHVGFLGAKPPAVKGLKAVQFDDEPEEVVEFATVESAGWGLRSAARLFRRFRDWLIETDGLETADRVIPEWDVSGIEEAARETDQPANPAPQFSENPETDPSETETPAPEDAPRLLGGTKETDMPKTTDTENTDHEAREAALKAREKEIADKEAAFAEAEAKRRHKDNEAFVSALVADGKFAPGHKDATVAFMDSLDHQDVVEFGEGDENKQTPLEFFKGLLTKGGTVIDFSETTADDGQDVGEIDSVTIGHQARAYQEEEATKGRKITTLEAVAHVKKQNKG